MTVKNIEQFFVNNGYTWKFSDGQRTPNAEEIAKTLTSAFSALSGEPDKAQLEVGRLVIQKNAGFYDVYVHIAEFDQ